MKKWARKYDQCRWCGTTKRKHKGHGLCINCFDKRRAMNPKRKAQLKANHDRWYNKVKDTDEYKEYVKAKSEKWREGKVYREYLKKVYAKNRVNRYLKTGWKTHAKKLDGVITIAVNGKHIKTTVKATPGNVGLTAIQLFEINYLRDKIIHTDKTEKNKSIN